MKKNKEHTYFCQIENRNRNKNNKMKNITLYMLITISVLFLFLQISKLKYANSSCNNEKTKLFVTSKLLNDAMKKVGQMSCKSSTNQVSTNGGWCSQISGSNSTSHVFDSSFAKGISQLLAGKQIISYPFIKSCFSQFLVH